MAKLRIFQYSEPILNDNIDILDDRVICCEYIRHDELICKCSPILSYYRTFDMPGVYLLYALGETSSKKLATLLPYIFTLYPREEEDMLNSFKKIYPNETITPEISKELITQPEHVITSYCNHNAFQTLSDDWYLYIEASKFNHSCNHNCTWDIDSRGNISITTLRNILEDEELTISYCQGIEPFDGRFRRNCLMELHFYCRCPECIDRCHTCNKIGAKNRCPNCKLTEYCSKACQRTDWSEHKKLCKYIA